MERKNLPHKDHRLKKKKQFSYIYKKGKRKSSKFLTLFYVESKYNNYLIGYSINKAIGKANVRNKLKRRLREIVRTSGYAKNYFNYVLLTRSGIENLSYMELENEVKKVFEEKKNI